MGLENFLLRIESDALRGLAQHWRAVRKGRLMPAWRDIDPRAIGPNLANIWAWRYDRQADCFTGRLAGETINAIFGRSLRGVAMRDFFPANTFDSVFARHRRVVTDPCAMHGRGPVFIHIGRYGNGERIILPLADDGLHPDGIIGMTIYRLEDLEDDSKGIPIPGMSYSSEEVTYFPINDEEP